MYQALLMDWIGLGRHAPVEVDRHLSEAARWLARAQDMTDDDGVAASYDLRRREWVSSYPETTGYIITTMYDYADYANRPEYAERAYRMAVWESEIQLPEGGVRAGKIDASTVAPTIFNTGQVLFGWARAYSETGEERFRKSLRAAADWLVEAQAEDGAWRSYPSPFTSHMINTYNTRTAFGLARAYETLGDQRYLHSAIANVAWAVDRALSNTWLPDNCLDNNDAPLTHTVAYSLRGILEVGELAGRVDFVEFALRMARHIASVQRRDGALPGRVDRDWRGTVRWSCLTGNAQMALNWLRLAGITGQGDMVDCAVRANRFNMSVQDINGSYEDTRGGIKGSYPVSGGYMKYKYPNWAAKFFMDALMSEQGYPVDRFKGQGP